MHTADLMYLHWTEQVLLHYYIIAMRVTVHHDSSTLHHDSSPLHHDSSTLHHDSSTVHHDSSTLHHDSSTLHHDISTSNHDSSTSNHESSTLQHDVSPAQLVEMQVPRADALDSSQFSDPAFLLLMHTPARSDGDKE